MRQTTLAITVLLNTLMSAALTSANAYTILDHAEVNLRLPSDWKLVDITRNPNAIITNYAKNANNNQREESLVEVQITKQSNKDPAILIKEISDRLKKQATDQHCEADDATPLPQDSDVAYHLWSQTMQCKLSQSGIIQYYLDVDPATLYLFTYTTPHYPLTSDLRDNANNMVKSASYVCYKGKDC